MSGSTSARLLTTSRRLAWWPLVWLASLLLASRLIVGGFWLSMLSVFPPRLHALEVIIVGLLLTAGWLSWPIAPSWEHRAARRLKVWRASGVLLMVASAAVVPALAYRIEHALPASLGVLDETLRRDLPVSVLTQLQAASLSNGLLVGLLCLSLISVLGRVRGTIVGLLTYAALVATSAQPSLSTFSPYRALMDERIEWALPYEPLWLPVLILLPVTLALWWSPRGVRL